MFSVKLGLKNLFRQKRRNIITILVIAFAFFVYLFLDSLMEGMEEMSFDNIRNYETGSIQIAHQEYWDDRENLPLDNLIVLDPDMEKNLRGIFGISGISPELKFKASLNNGIDEIAVQGLGISIESYNQVYDTQNHIVEGAMFLPGEAKAVLGVSLAELMDLNVGDYITLLVRTKENTFNTIDLEISGLLYTPHPLTNIGIVFVPLNIAQDALNVENMASLVNLKTEKDKYINPGIISLNKTFQEKGLNFKAYSWEESTKQILAISSAQDVETAIMLFIILTIGMLGIINNIILSALERTREIGMMKALGMREWEIVSVFMVEAIGLGIIGGLAGCLLGFAGVWWITEIGYGLGYVGGDMSMYGVPIIDRIYGVWKFSSFIFIFFFGIVVAIFSSIIPAYWAAHKDPVKSIYSR